MKRGMSVDDYDLEGRQIEKMHEFQVQVVTYISRYSPIYNIFPKLFFQSH